jgi:hypothetical protein
MTPRLGTWLALIAATLLADLRPALAEDCKKSEQAALQFARNMESAGQLAVELVVRCMFHGPDDRAVDKLAASARKTFGPSSKDPDIRPACVQVGDAGSIFHTIGRAAGERMGLAFSLCSPKAQARIAELTKQNAKPEDIQAELGRMASAWLESVTH